MSTFKENNGIGSIRDKGPAKTVDGISYRGDGQGNWYQNQFKTPSYKQAGFLEKYITGTSPNSNRIETNQGLASSAYDNLNAKFESGALSQGDYSAGIDALNKNTIQASDSGAFQKSEGLAGIAGNLGTVNTLVGIAGGINNIMNSRAGVKAAKDQLKLDNKRKDELMAMNRERYNTFKADKARLGASYGGN